MIRSLLLLAMFSAHDPDAIDTCPLDTLLRTWVHAGSVAYGITEQPAFRTTLQALAQVRMDTASVAARLAVWMNAHTVGVILCTSQRGDGGMGRLGDGAIQSVDGERWTVDVSQTLTSDSISHSVSPTSAVLRPLCNLPITISGRSYTLQMIRDTILALTGSALPVFWFASGSSLWPPIPNRAARADTVLSLLRSQARKVCRSKKFVQYDPGDNVLQLPEFLGVYDSTITARHGGLVQFVLPWVEPLVAAELALHREGLRVVVTDRIETKRKRQAPLIKKL